MTSMDAKMSSWLDKAVIMIEATPGGYNTSSMTESRRALIAAGVVFTFLGSFAVFCRIVALLHRQRQVGYDDWALFASFTFAVGFAVSSFASVRWGVGLEMEDVPPVWVIRAIQAVYVVEIFYYFSIFLIKISIMGSYWRLASELRNHFYYGTIFLTGVLCVHFATTVIVFSVQCVPMEKYWNPSVHGSCINITAFFYSTNVFTIVTDLVMLALPVPTIWRVQRPRRQKIGLITAFLCGGLSTFASCARLYSIRIYTQSSQPIRDAAPINTWSFIEINVGICCASIAVVKQLITAVRNGSLTPERKRSNTGETWLACSTPASGGKYTAVENEFETWSRETKSELEACAGRNDSTIRQSRPLPPPPRYQDEYAGETALPQRPDQPVLRAFVSSEHDDDSLMSLGNSKCLTRCSWPQKMR